MKICRVWLENIPGSPYSQSAQHEEPKLDRESHDDHDARTWRSKCTTNDHGQICIPAMALKQCIDHAAAGRCRAGDDQRQRRRRPRLRQTRETSLSFVQ